MRFLARKHQPSFRGLSIASVRTLLVIASAAGIPVVHSGDPFIDPSGNQPFTGFSDGSSLYQTSLPQWADLSQAIPAGIDDKAAGSIGSMIESGYSPQGPIGPVVALVNESPTTPAQSPSSDSVPGAATSIIQNRRPGMFLSRQASEFGVGSDPVPTASSAVLSEDEAGAALTGEGRFIRQATPFRTVSMPTLLQSPNETFERLPPPPGVPPGLGARNGTELWDYEAETLGEGSFMERLRDPATAEGQPFDLGVLDRSILNNDPSYGVYEADGPESLWSPRVIADELADDLRETRILARRATARVYAPFNRAINSIMATRQRVDSGLGLLLVANAPIVLDTTQPMQQVRIRNDFGFGLGFPDRSEYFWAAPGRGPGYQGELDYREFAFMFEVGGDAFSVQTEIPIRGYSPEFGDGHTAVGDIRITQKTRLLNGNDFQLTQMLRVHTPSGNVKAGAGTGHTSMEPGALMRYRYNDWTYLHSELKYWIPMGGNPNFSGDVLTYGFGVSTVWYESLTRAVIPTLEVSSLNFLTGSKTGPFGPERVSRDATATLHPGVRFAWDPGGDLGVAELGVSTGLAISRDTYYDSLLRFELRFTR
jgi:hypothetical protein